MPTVLLKAGFRFFFYSSDGNEPAHIHVVKGDGTGKIWLEPEVAIAYMYRFSAAELRQIENLIQQYEQVMKTKWYEYFGK